MDNTRRRAYIKEKLEQADHRLRGMDLAEVHLAERHEEHAEHKHGEERLKDRLGIK